jgi:hypothetical protein
MTALMYSVLTRQFECSKLLLDNEADTAKTNFVRIVSKLIYIQVSLKLSILLNDLNQFKINKVGADCLWRS